MEPPSSPLQPTSAELLQMLAKSQRALDENVRNHVHQEPEPAQYNNYKDFLDTEPPIFREAEEPLQADEWLNTIEQKFYVLKVADYMKTEYASQQLQGPAGVWWCHYWNTLPENMEVVWDQFKEAFRGHYVPASLMAIKHNEFMKLT
jgi:arylsulfatase A-like enzyme